jgi:hypothetical protein
MKSIEPTPFGVWGTGTANGRGRLGLSVELYFRPDRPLPDYVRDAISADRIAC